MFYNGYKVKNNRTLQEFLISGQSENHILYFLKISFRRILSFSISHGIVTCARENAIGTFHSLPVTFQYSSSWLEKAFSAPRTR